MITKASMKKRDLEKLFLKNGWIKLQGSKHEKWVKGKETEMLPRHAEINEILAKDIIKRRGLK
jgi:mRNA interferase HicA